MSKFNLSIYYQNTRGLRTKTHEFYRSLISTNFDVIVLTETWLNKNILSSELFDDRYIVYRRDRESTGFHRNKEGGGVLIAVAKHICSCRILKWESNCEDLWVKLHLGNTRNEIILCAVYLPPPFQKSILDHFIDNCNKISDQSGATLCLCGDFNLSSMNWALLDSPSLKIPCSYIPFLDFLDLNNLKQYNFCLNSKGRTLDLVLTNIQPCRVTRATDELVSIDPLHPPLTVDLHMENWVPLNYKKNTGRLNFYRADYDAINEYLKEVDWETRFSEARNVDQMTTIFYEVVRDAISKFVPLTIPKNKRYPPWFSRDLIKRLREKNKYRLLFRKYGNPLDQISYRLHTERCKKNYDDLLQILRT